MKIQNNTQTTYTHGDLKLLPNGEVTEVKDEKIAKVWLSIDGIVEYVAPEDAKAEVKALKEKIKKLEEENAALKGENNKKEPETELEALKEEAGKLGISYAKNIGVNTLIKKIEEAKEKLGQTEE